MELRKQSGKGRGGVEGEEGGGEREGRRSRGEERRKSRGRERKGRGGRQHVQNKRRIKVKSYLFFFIYCRLMYTRIPYMLSL